MVDRYGISAPQMTTIYVPLVLNTSRSFPHSWRITRCVTGLTRRVQLVEQELHILPEHLSSHRYLVEFRVTPSLVLNVCFVDRCLSLCTFSFGHCVVCSSIYGLWLLLWYLQTHKKATQNTKTMSYTDPTLKTEMHSGAREG